MKLLALYDGTLQSKAVLRYGLDKAREKKAELIVLQVFQASLFVDYAGPGAAEAARAEAEHYRQEAEAMIRETPGARVSFRFEEGDPAEEAVRTAEHEHIDLVLASPRYKALVRKTACPVLIMPGTILVPIDASAAVKADIDTISAEAKASGSRLMLLGIVPVHIYSSAEKQELAEVRTATEAAVKKIRKALTERGLAADTEIREGYPDEEILKAADASSASLIMLPSGGKTPSELAKAAAILLDEPERVRMPIFLLDPAT